ncbi:hypothetical protein IJG27_04535 [Candidatus Saccharibacteria bacterium]|nr:hypothetical protein [Candidatus Saccharibacteria bacterium]
MSPSATTGANYKFGICCSPTRHILRFTYGPNGKECYGTWNGTSQKGWGPGYGNNCIHSGAISSSGDLPTNWYNYALASAGTIVEENTTSSNPATNIDPATESICPKGWTLPDLTQIQSIGNNTSAYVSSFYPVLGGGYSSGTLNNEATHGYWWGSEAYRGATRYRLDYNGSLYTYDGSRRSGLYVRCVQAP